jgi:hypothetical protein
MDYYAASQQQNFLKTQNSHVEKIQYYTSPSGSTPISSTMLYTAAPMAQPQMQHQQQQQAAAAAAMAAHMVYVPTVGAFDPYAAAAASSFMWPYPNQTQTSAQTAVAANGGFYDGRAQQPAFYLPSSPPDGGSRQQIQQAAQFQQQAATLAAMAQQQMYTPATAAPTVLQPGYISSMSANSPFVPPPPHPHPGAPPPIRAPSLPPPAASSTLPGAAAPDPVSGPHRRLGPRD